MPCDPLDPNYDECVRLENEAQSQPGGDTTGGDSGGGGGGGAPLPDPTDTGPDTGLFGGIGGSTAARVVSVPGNLEETINDLAKYYGMDPRLLAAAIQQSTRWRRKEINAANLNRIASNIAAEFKRLSTPSDRDLSRYPGEPRAMVPSARAAWLAAAAKVTGTSVNTIENLVTKDPTTSGDLAFGGGVAKQPLIPGLTDDAAFAVQRVADSLFIQYLARVPTTEEYNNISRSGWTADTLTTWLRAQPHPDGGTVGQHDDTHALARKSAQQWLGREPDSGELAYLVAQGLTSADQVDAYYNQLKQRHDTGDPAFAWAADPTTWRSTEAQIESLWKRSGLTTAVDPHLVNQAVAGKWSIDDVQRSIDALPAPGFATGVTVGQVSRVKPIAQGYKDTISHIHQGEPLTNDEISMFLGTGGNPASIRDYYRSLPARGRSGTAAPAGQPPQEQAQAPAPPPTPAQQPAQTTTEKPVAVPVKRKDGTWTTSDKMTAATY